VYVRARRVYEQKKHKAGIFVLKVTVMDTGRDFMFGSRLQVLL
jgi:hypothetical protein